MLAAVLSKARRTWWREVNRRTIFGLLYNKIVQLGPFTSNGQIRVSKYEKTNHEGFPYASLTDGGRTESAIIDNRRFKRTYFYNLRVYQEIVAQDRGRAEGERILRQVEDAIVDWLNSNYALSFPGVLRTRPLNTVYGYLENGRLRYFDLTIAVETAVSGAN